MARSRSKRIGVLNLESTIRQLLGEYGNDVYRVLGVCALEVAEESAKKLQKGGAFGGTGAYKNDWTYQEEMGKRFKQGYIVYNAEHYRLAHLLEKGHVLRDGTGRQVGETGKFPHIKDVELWAQDELQRKVRLMMNDI